MIVERWIAGTYAIWSEYCGAVIKYLGVARNEVQCQNDQPGTAWRLDGKKTMTAVWR